MSTESIMNNSSPSMNNSACGGTGRLRSRTFSHRPSLVFANNINQTTNSNNTASLNIRENNNNGSPLSSESIRKRSKSAIGVGGLYAQLTLSSHFLLDKYEEDLSDKLNKIESSNLSIKNLFNHKRRLSAYSNQRPTIEITM
ncbi:predicted protein [Naegleria gruberi]|uniref:Predicted protein n=1 Tax=Naegleria gruberi TaxID=5762 RepID=D2VPP7_NAEGR|nr:uncharacterized protein NAEGRDRAFT_70938 [Naegleria gruberi]EFC41165.1 predicted protein [Naegleria gruberi]|eukprot:XP_002673909.1 predicted protein [Naegleria gruberi strain NEG-M]